jgi:hypothetical protein
MTRNEAILTLVRAPQKTLKYQGSGFGNKLAAKLSQQGVIELKNEWGPDCTMTLTDWGEILADEIQANEEP